MKRIGFLLVLTLALLVIGSGDACGIRVGRGMRSFKRPVRKMNVQINRRVAVARALAKKTKATAIASKQLRQTQQATMHTQMARFEQRGETGGNYVRAPKPEVVQVRQRNLALNRTYFLREFPAKKEVDAVIFDLDGTLLDSLWAWKDSGVNYLRSIGIEPPADLQAKLEEMSLMDGANYLKETYQLAEPPEVILERTLAPIKHRYMYEILPMPDVVEQLARLKAQGVKMAVATASHGEFAQAALKRLGMLDYFEFIITCDEVGIGKTSPKVYEVAQERLGTARERTLVAEDALYALETAHKAGFLTAAIEELHSLHQQVEKRNIADYYVIEYEGENTAVKGSLSEGNVPLYNRNLSE